MKALFIDAGEVARSAALSATSARLTATNTLLHDVATIQRHAEALCPGEHHISDVMSEFSLDEPESSHDVHAELTPEAEPSSGTEPTAPVLTGVETEAFYQPPVHDMNPPQVWAQALAHLAANSSDSQASGQAGESCAPAVEMPESSPPAVGELEVPAVERQWPAVGVPESPLPAMMSELHEAMTASVSSAGKPCKTLELWLHCILLPDAMSRQTAHQAVSHHTTPHITSHHITSHHITSHHITPHHTTSHHTTPHHITSASHTLICRVMVTSHVPVATFVACGVMS